MQLQVKVTRGCLFKVTDKNAILLMSDYCPKDLREKFADRAKEILSKLGTIKEPYQGIFYDPNHIVVENFSKSKKLRFVWTNEVLVVSDLAIPKSKEPRRRREKAEA